MAVCESLIAKGMVFRSGDCMFIPEQKFGKFGELGVVQCD